jgi:aryl-alcohol dehydrogenase-like predicted oxidoreductase
MITSDSSVIARAVDMGITYFDTARGYQSGNNERRVGAALKGHRNKIVLSSKSAAKTGKEAADQIDTRLREGALVAETIRYLSYAEFYGQFGLGREHFLSLPDEAPASRCGDCESCSVHCPNGVRLSQRLIRAQELFS